MYCVIQTKGVDEPWWMMDDWKEMIVLEESCSTLEEAKELLDNLKNILGETDSEVVSARNSIELEEFFKELE